MGELLEMCDEANFIIDLARELSWEYKEQYNNMESFARWNLPEEIGLEWEGAELIIKKAEDEEMFSKEAMSTINEIFNNFDSAFDDMTSEVWTHRAMQVHPFWMKQRELAKKVLSLTIDSK